MKTILFVAAASAALVASGCNAEKGKDATPVASAPVKAVKPPRGGDWSETVSATKEGGFIMGNPDAAVKLVEFGSMTCPHCAEFDETGAKPLIDTYVKTGKVSYEFRNFVRDPYDLAASLVARCNGPASFFGITRALYADQQNWVAKIQGADQAKVAALQTMAPGDQFKAIAEMAGFPAWAAQRGVPAAKTNACLADEKAVSQLVQMNSDAISSYNIPGTPSFLINGVLADKTSTWETLAPKLKAAVGG